MKAIPVEETIHETVMTVPIKMASCVGCSHPIAMASMNGEEMPWTHLLSQQQECDV